ncbi:sensor histidine kinase [Alteribacillus sp. HJP-4]|uniref:sensor histidine kinase n=1 Tax=Alteribacillus sp. HJP-4 TaxID=2775394 RepID=UPI0035CD1E1D
MSIRKRLILSNIGMVLLPILALFIMEIFLGVLLFRLLDIGPNNRVEIFTRLRFAGLILILILTNGLLTYYVSKSILSPVRKLSDASRQIAGGNLDFEIKSERSDEIGELSENFNEMRKKLKEAEGIQRKYEENRQELIASISHDLKTPITSIKGYVAGIRDGVADTPERMERYVQTIEKKTLEMEHLIDELFLYSRLDVNRVPFQFAKVDLSLYFQDLLADIRFDQPALEASLQTRAEDTYHAKADREQLSRAVRNIIQNSLKYMNSSERKLTIVLKKIEMNLEVTIKDNGPGIPARHLPHVFDQFYRADPSRSSVVGGSGLGLAIAKKIIEAHNGRIWVESKEREGTSVIFTLNQWEEEVERHGSDFDYRG